MAATFRTAPMGFNKKDVIEYIEQLVADKNGKIEAAWEEYKSLETQSRKTEIAAERLLRDAEERAENAENRLAQMEEANAALGEEKVLLEERAMGSEQAFADLETAMAELRAAHAAELEALRASHAEELQAIYAERSAQLDRKAEQIRALETDMADKDAEIASLREKNLSLLSRTDDLSALVTFYEEEADVADDLYDDDQTSLAAFKTRFIEITGELSQLAQALLDAEKREGRMSEQEEDDSLTFPIELSEDETAGGAEDAGDMAMPFEEDDLLFAEDERDDPAAAETVTRIEVTDYPDPARAPKPVQKKAPSVRDLLERLRTIGDRLL